MYLNWSKNEVSTKDEEQMKIANNQVNNEEKLLLSFEEAKKKILEIFSK